MKDLMTKSFSKWVLKHHIPKGEVIKALSELKAGKFEADLGSFLYKKRIRFEGQGKSGSGRMMVCYKKKDRTIIIGGFAKNEDGLTKKVEIELKRISKIFIEYSLEKINNAIKNGEFLEVRE